MPGPGRERPREARPIVPEPMRTVLPREYYFYRSTTKGGFFQRRVLKLELLTGGIRRRRTVGQIAVNGE